MFRLNKLGVHETATLFMFICSVFLILLASILTISPIVKYHNLSFPMRWDHWIGVGIDLFVFWFLHYSLINKRKNFDPYFLPILMLLIGWGLTTIYRITPAFGFRQSLWLAWVLIPGWITIKNGTKAIQFLFNNSATIYCLTLAALLLTFVIGVYPGGNGPKLWLGCCGLYIQPAEFYKLALILYLAKLFTSKNSTSPFRYLAKATLLIILSISFFIVQRDLGSAVVVMVFSILFVFLVTEKKRVLGIGAIILIIFTIIGFHTIELVQSRLSSWLIPWGQTQSGSYQVIQSVIAIASGGIVGTGIGMGSPGIVPLAHSDFIFAAIAEESGLVGCIGLIALFLFILSRALRIAKYSESPYHRYIAGGIAITFFVHIILIMGGNTRLLPITGITLPFMSYGGSSLSTSFFAFMLVLVLSPDVRNRQITNRRNFTVNTILVFFSSGFFAIALACGWWSVIRVNELLSRPDNLRTLLADNYVPRGSIYDRNGILLAETIGEVGSLSRNYLYLSMSNVLGYDSVRYGRAGIEAGLNDYLRGNRGYPAFTQWIENLITNQPLRGLDVRLTIDSKIQESISRMLQERKGGVAVINAASGEILALSSFPSFNANVLEAEYENLKNDPDAPFINRATQSQYPSGKFLLPLVLLKKNEAELINLLNTEAKILTNCNQQNDPFFSFSAALTEGCEDAVMLVLNVAEDEEFRNVLENLKLPQNVSGLITNAFKLPEPISRFSITRGSAQIRSNPLQIAYAYSILSTDGELALPRIHDAVKTPNGAWVSIGNPTTSRIFPTGISTLVREFLVSDSIPGWEANFQTTDENGAYSWFVGGIYSTAGINPIVVAVAIESESISSSKQIGHAILLSIILSQP